MASRKERSRLAAQRRQQRLLMDRDAIKLLRQHFTGYGAREGFSLKLKDIAALPASKRRALRKKQTALAHLLSKPHAEVKARTKAEAKVLRRATHQRMKGLKHFIVHVPHPTRSKARMVEGQLEISTKLPGRAEVEERIFWLPRRPDNPDDLIAMLEEMLPDMPDSGEYYMQTDTYGDTGAIADKGSLRRQLQTYLASYDKAKYGRHRFMNRVIGWRWVRSKLAGKIVKPLHTTEARDREREAYRQRREGYRKEAAKLIRRRKRGKT